MTEPTTTAPNPSPVATAPNPSPVAAAPVTTVLTPQPVPVTQIISPAPVSLDDLTKSETQVVDRLATFRDLFAKTFNVTGFEFNYGNTQTVPYATAIVNKTQIRINAITSGAHVEWIINANIFYHNRGNDTLEARQTILENAIREAAHIP